MSEEPKTGMERARVCAGDGAKLGRMLQPPVSQQAISEWVHQGWAPVGRARQIAEATGIPIRELVKPEIVELFE